MDFINEFKLALMEFGLVPPDNIVADGKRHRFSSTGAKGDQNGWYVLYGDNMPAGAFGCWKNSINEKWKSSEKKTFTPEQRAAYAQRIKDVEQERADAEQRDRDYAKKTSAEMWARAGDVPPDHPYITRKQIQPIGIKMLDGELLIPVRSDSKTMVGLQKIPFEVGGTKKPVFGTPMQGGYFTLGITKNTTKIFIVEGYATGVSVHMATGDGVVVAFNAGNLLLVAQKIRKAMPDIEIVIASDDDFKTVRPAGHPDAGKPWNVGRIAATEAANAVGGYVVYPVFTYGRDDKDTDFNDLHVSEGLDTVKRCLLSRGEAHEEVTSMTEIVFDKTGKNTVEAQATVVSVEVREEPNNAVSSDTGTFRLSASTVQYESSPTLTGDGSDVKPSVVSRHNIVTTYNLDATDKGVPFTSTANIVRVLQGDRNLSRKIWFDEFLGRIMTVWGSRDPREWAEIDDINLQIYLQESLGMPKLGKQTVSDAVNATAYADTRNECKAYITGVKWDGVERLPTFLIECFGAKDSEYIRCASSNFWLSMVARVLRPGCKVDEMIVLEGAQGAGKSAALAEIGGRWFTEATQSPTEKDFYLNLAGKMIIEIGEMDAFNRSEVTKVKQVITCKTDRYRAPYERRAMDHPRMCVFAGTTNRDDWNKDETGARRFHPVMCGKIDHKLIVEQRDQLFAEAAHKLANGATWWEMPQAETLAEQESRRDHDTLEEQLRDWLKTRGEISVKEIMSDMMEEPISRQDSALQKRVAKALRAIGWTKNANGVRRNGQLVRLWMNPVADKELPF